MFSGFSYLLLLVFLKANTLMQNILRKIGIRYTSVLPFENTKFLGGYVCSGDATKLANDIEIPDTGG